MNQDFKDLTTVLEEKPQDTPQATVDVRDGMPQAYVEAESATTKPQEVKPQAKPSKASKRKAKRLAKQGNQKPHKPSTNLVEADSQIVELTASIAKLNAQLEAIDLERSNGETLMQRLAKSTPILAELAKLEASKSERMGELVGVAITSEATKLIHVDLGIDSKVNARVVVNPTTLANATAIYTLIRLAKEHGITDAYLIWNQSIGDEANPTTTTSFKVGEASQKSTRKPSGSGGGGRKTYTNGTVVLGSKELFLKVESMLPKEFLDGLKGTLKVHAYGNVIDSAIANGHLKGYTLVVKDS